MIQQNTERKKNMKIEEAVAILHPDTSKEALREYCYFHGIDFESKEDVLKVINEACVLVCNIVKQIGEFE